MGKVPDALRNTIATNVRFCRKRQYPGRGGGKRCAEAFGVSPQQWSPRESRKRVPDELRLQQIADFFGVTVAWLREDHSDDTSDMPEPASTISPTSEPIYNSVHTLLDLVRRSGVRIHISGIDILPPTEAGTAEALPYQSPLPVPPVRVPAADGKTPPEPGKCQRSGPQR